MHGAHGAISPATTQTVAYGADSATFTTTPEAGFGIDDVLDGSSVGTPTAYRFTNVIANHTIAATFAPDTP